MADKVRVELVIEYPLGTPQSYGGETDPDAQVKMEEAYINDVAGGYLLAVLNHPQSDVRVFSVSRVDR